MAGQYSFNDLTGVLGGDTLASLFGNLGFSNLDGSGGIGENPWQMEGGINEAGNTMWGGPNEAALRGVKDYSFDWTPTGGQGGTLTAFNPQGDVFKTFQQEDEGGLTKLMNVIAPAVASWGFGSGLAGMFGGGAVGGGLGHGLASGAMSSMQGDSFGKGFLSGAIGGGLNGLGQGTSAIPGNNPSAYTPAQAGTSLSGLAGITNPTGAAMFNRGVGSTLGALATGKSGNEALQSGLTGAVLSGINSLGSRGMDFIKSSFNSLLDDQQGFADLQGSGGDMSGMTDVSPNRYEEMITGADGLESYNPSYAFAGDQLPNFGMQESPQKSAQSFSQGLPALFSNFGDSVGKYIGNNAGDLASMLYGFYNNRRQQKALGSQLQSLEGLYGQNSPYAQQLRATLNAKAAATGRRSNLAGREVQLQAALADRYAQLQPTMMQLNQARGQLKNQNMNMLLQGANKMGAFRSLADLFRPQQDYNALGLLEAGR